MSDASTPPTNLARLATSSAIWSIAQAWLTRGSTLLLFVFLARVLTPAEYGLATAAATVLLALTMVAELGYSDAIIQRPNLRAHEQTLPFIVSILVSIALAGAAIIVSPSIELAIGANGLAPFIVALAPAAPLTAMLLFQEANYKRALDYRSLTVRVLISNLIAGPVAIAAAYAGAGPWSLVLHGYLTILVGLGWLWSRPKWVPTRPFNSAAFWQLTGFGAPIVSLRILDFVASRTVDALIIYRFGLGAYGLFAVASRLYQVISQLFQSAISDVSLSVLSRVSSDLPRVQRAYFLSLAASSIFGTPVFVALAANANQLPVLFGSQWEGVGDLAWPLLLVGAVQAVQFLNGAYINARGRPRVMLAIAVIKYAAIFAGLVSLPSSSPSDLVLVFGLLQLVATPMSFAAVVYELRISPVRIIYTVAPSIIACTLGYIATQTVIGDHTPSIISFGIGIIIFYCTFTVAMFVVGRRQVRSVVEFARKSRRNPQS